MSHWCFPILREVVEPTVPGGGRLVNEPGSPRFRIPADLGLGKLMNRAEAKLSSVSSETIGRSLGAPVADALKHKNRDYIRRLGFDVLFAINEVTENICMGMSDSI
jgi:hypothetical protein